MMFINYYYTHIDGFIARKEVSRLGFGPSNVRANKDYTYQNYRNFQEYLYMNNMIARVSLFWAIGQAEVLERKFDQVFM